MTVDDSWRATLAASWDGETTLMKNSLDILYLSYLKNLLKASINTSCKFHICYLSISSISPRVNGLYVLFPQVSRFDFSTGDGCSAVEAPRYVQNHSLWSQRSFAGSRRTTIDSLPGATLLGGPCQIVSTLRLPTPPMETPDPPSDTPGASKQVVLTPHDIPRSLRVARITPIYKP